MNPRTALVLRLLGPLIEIACLVLLNRFGARGASIAGRPVEYLLWAGLAVGFAMVVLGLTLGRPASRRPRDHGRDPGGPR